MSLEPYQWVDPSPLNYTPFSPESIPLGGSQSALCYLTRALAQQGHSIRVYNGASRPGHRKHLSWEPLGAGATLGTRAVFLNHLPFAEGVLWTQHLPADPAMRLWPEFQGTTVFVSQWQAESYRAYFPHAETSRTSWVIPNGVNPCFLGLFPDKEALIESKKGPIRLAYTSTPHRGLALLLALFPALKRRFPEVVLEVFSSFEVYQQAVPSAQKLYALARETEGVNYWGSVPQPELAEHLKSCHILAYPNTFAETSCIAVLEALAAGCRVVSTAQGALPETSAGFARLLPPQSYEAYTLAFLEALSEEITIWQKTPQMQLNQSWAQIAHVVAHHDWAQLAQRWMAGCLPAQEA